MATLHVTLHADIDGDLIAAGATDETIPPGYGQADIDALAVNRIERTAFRANRDAFGRTAALAALIAATARLKAFEELLEDAEPGPTRERIREILEVSNDEATVRWGEEPEGE